METAFLVINLFPFFCSIIFNTLHILIVYNRKQKLNAVILARVLPPCFLLLISVILYSMDIFRATHMTDDTMLMFNTFEDRVEVFQIGIYLGMNLVEGITKFRSYKISGRATILMKKKSVIVPVCLVLLASLLVSLISCFYDALHSGTKSLTLAFVSELTFYYAGGIIPTFAVYIMFAFQALQYYRNSSKVNMFASNSVRIPPQLKQLQRIKTYIMLHFTTFMFCWSPFLALKILIFQSTNLSTVQTYRTLITSIKLMMFALNPIANGLLLAGERQKIVHLFDTVVQFSIGKLRRYCSLSHETKSDGDAAHEVNNSTSLEGGNNSEQNYNITISCLEDKNSSSNDNIIIADSFDVVNPEFQGEFEGINLCVRRHLRSLQEQQSFDSLFDNPSCCSLSRKSSSEKALFSPNTTNTSSTEYI